MKVYKILIIEDEPAYLRMLADTLELENFETAAAANGKQGLVKTEEFAPDLVLCDINMPEMSGIEFLQEIRKTHSMEQLPVVMITAYNASEFELPALLAGANDFVSKDTSYEVWILRINNILKAKKGLESVEQQNTGIIKSLETVVPRFNPESKETYKKNNVFTAASSKSILGKPVVWINEAGGFLQLNVSSFNKGRIENSILGAVFVSLLHTINSNSHSLVFLKSLLQILSKQLPKTITGFNDMSVAHCTLHRKTQEYSYTLMGGSCYVVYTNGLTRYVTSRAIDSRGYIYISEKTFSTKDVVAVFLCNTVLKDKDDSRLLGILKQNVHRNIEEQKQEAEAFMRKQYNDKNIVITGINI